MSTPDKSTIIKIPVYPSAKPPEAAPPRSATTSRVLWIAAYVVVMVLVAIRLPAINQNLTRQVPQEVRSELGDDRLLGLSMMVGTVLFFVAYAVIMYLFLSVTSVLDKRLVPGKAELGSRWQVGLYYVIAVLATVPVQLAGLLFSSFQPRDLPGYWIYFPVMALGVLALFRRHWKKYAAIRQVFIAVAAIALAAAVSIG